MSSFDVLPHSGYLIRLELPLSVLSTLWNHQLIQSNTLVRIQLFGKSKGQFANPQLKKFGFRGYKSYISDPGLPVKLFNTMVSDPNLPTDVVELLEDTIEPDDIGAYLTDANDKVFKGFSKEQTGSPFEGDQYFLRLDSTSAISPESLGPDTTLTLHRRGVSFQVTITDIQAINKGRVHVFYGMRS